MSTDGLSSICGGLGCIEEDDSGKRIGYTKGEYALDNLKDLLRFLRRDDPETRDVFKQVCKWNTVPNDIIPIIEYYQDDRNLVLNAVKVLVFLTMPLEVSSTDAHEQLEYLWGLKSAFARSDVIAVAVSLLEKPLENLELGAFTDDDRKLVQLVFTLIRNILAVQDISVNQKTAGSANYLLSLRDSFLELLFRESVMDVILVLAQHVGGDHCNLRHDNLLLLEIFYYIFKGQDPELVAKTHASSKKVDKDAYACAESLQAIMKEEEEKKKKKKLQSLARHSKFYGTFMSFTMDGSKALCKGPAPASRSSLPEPKVHRGASKRVASGLKRLPTSNKDTLILLHDFLNQFLLGGYNELMQSVLEDIEMEYHAVQNSDVVVFFQLAQFATSYQYFRIRSNEQNPVIDSAGATPSRDGGEQLFEGGICGPVAETMKESMLALLTSKWRYAVDTLKETNDYMFLGTAASLFKIMISMLDLVLKSVTEDTKEHQTACALLYKLFYDQTDQGLTHFLLNLMNSFNSHKQPKSNLADLVEIIQLVLRLTETLQANGTLRVSKKTRKRRKKNSAGSVDNKKENNSDQDVIHSEIHAPVSGEHSTTDPMQKENIVQSESDGQNEGPADNGLGHELDAEGREPVSKLSQIEGGTEFTEEDFIDVEDNNESSGDEQNAMTDEVDFKITRLLTSLANNTTIRNMCWLLGSYKSNSVKTNHSVICMLQRICDDLNLSPMLYQLSYLCIFSNILDEQESSPSKDYEHIVNFLTTLVRKMLRKMKSQPLLFVEVLLSKTRRDCHFINVESMKLEVGDMGREVRNWEHNSNNGDASLPQANRSSWMADALGEDECDVIVSDGTDHEDEILAEEDGQQKIKLSSDLELEESAKGRAEILTEENGKRKRKLNINQEPEESTKSRRMGRLNASDDEKIRSLFEQFKDQKRCSHMIAESLDPDGKIKAAQVSRRLRKLGLRSTQRRRSKANSTTETTHDAPTEEDSDNLTLSTLKKRKSKTNLEETDKAKTASIQLPVESYDIEGGIAQSFMERDSEVEPAAQNDSHDGPDSAKVFASSEHEAPSADDEPQSHHDDGNEVNQQSYSELEDSDVDMTASTPERSMSRRKLRMILDPDDDE